MCCNRNNGRTCGVAVVGYQGQNWGCGNRNGNCSTCPVRNRCGAFQSGYRAGFEAGRVNGYNSGYQAGYEVGYQAGYEAGFEAGRNSGSIRCETVCRRELNC